MANKPQALIKLSGPNRKVSFISEDGETISAIKEGINTYKLSGSDSPTPIIESVYTYKGSKATYDELPTENNKVGDVWNVVAEHDTTPAGTNYAWTGTEWDALGGTYTDTNTWRPIQVGGTDKLTDASTAINFTGGGGTSVSYENGTITVSSPAIGTESTQVAAGNHTHSGYAATSHNHTTSQITDFPTLATVATSGSYNDLKNKPTIPAAYTLPAATTSVLGGVKIDDSTIKINNDGQLYANVEGGGGSSTGDWGTKVVTVTSYGSTKTSLQAVTSLTEDPGATRGNGAVDLQQSRTYNTQVASGEYSVVIGKDNRASGSCSVAIGQSNTAGGTASVAMGNASRTSNSFSFAFGSSVNVVSPKCVAFGNRYTVNDNDGDNGNYPGPQACVCVNDAINEYHSSSYLNAFGYCGFSGIKLDGRDNDKHDSFFPFRLTDVIVAMLQFIAVNKKTGERVAYGTRQLAIAEGEIKKNEILFNGKGMENYNFTANYGYLHFNQNANEEYQIGIFYTKFGSIDTSQDSDSQSSGGAVGVGT